MKELRSLSKEERKRQQLAVTDVIKNADIILTTLTGALTKKLDKTTFDLVIIDEAAQALEIACWIALLKVTFPGVIVFSCWITYHHADCQKNVKLSFPFSFLVVSGARRVSR